KHSYFNQSPRAVQKSGLRPILFGAIVSRENKTTREILHFHCLLIYKQTPISLTLEVMGSAKTLKRRRTQALKPESPKSVIEFDDEEEIDYSDVYCEKCHSGSAADKLLLCDKCDRGFHIFCLKPVLVSVPKGAWFCPSCNNQVKKLKKFPLVQTKIIDFFRIQKPSELVEKPNKDNRKRRKSLLVAKKKRKLLPFTPSEEPKRRLEQMASLATAMKACRMVEFNNELTYIRGMAPRSENSAVLEKGGMQVLSKEDSDTLKLCKNMMERGEGPPLMVVLTLRKDKFIKDLTIITEYTGDVDYLKNREYGDGDSMMTLLSADDSSQSLVICPDERGNIARFINGINNHTPEGKKKQNLKCVRFDIDGEARVLLIANRDIPRGERFTVEADKFIKDLTIITEYTGDVDYLKNREYGDGDSMMTLLSADDSSQSLVICPDERGNIARFINGINNHTPEGKKKQNLKCVRFDIDGEARVLLIANRDIPRGERLYYDYNGYEHEYPTEHFV
ncbi:hypothetical protein IFM89_029689, partial [Coptis chinensis]